MKTIKEVLASKRISYSVTAHKEHRFETTFDLSDTVILRITTLRGYNKKVITYASTNKLENGMLIHRMGDDFSKQYEVIYPARCTKKFVEDQHALVNEVSVITDCINWYEVRGYQL